MRMRSISLCSLFFTLALHGCSAPMRLPIMEMGTWVQTIRTAPLPTFVLLGEQHDALEHQHWQQATVQTLIARQQLAAVVLEMADQGHSTQGLPMSATERDVQQVLQWNEPAWPWKAYGPSVMTAVRAGVPVVGGNLPRAHMKTVMQQNAWDTHLPAPAWARQRDAIRSGHCDLLPESQITPMARIQLAKDARMAQTMQAHAHPHKTVLLIAGHGHVLRSVGVPTWLPADLTTSIAIAQASTQPPVAPTDSDHVVRTPAMPATDHCAALRTQWGVKLAK